MTSSESDKELFENARCIVCRNSGGGGFSVQYRKGGITVIRCSVCGFVFIPPLYRRVVDYGQYKSPEVVREIARGNQWLKIRKNLSRFRLLRKYVRSGSLYDIGCGFGHFLLAGKELGFGVTGVEISRANVRYVREELGIGIEEGDFLGVDENRRFDLMTLWDVLEHVDRADLLVAKASRMLEPGGILVLQVPAIDSFFSRVFRENWWAVGIDHVNYFSRTTVARLLDAHGIDVMKIVPSIELKYFLLYAILPLFRRPGQTGGELSGLERQKTFNRLTNRPLWMLRIMVLVNNALERILSFFRITDEMIVIGKKREA